MFKQLESINECDVVRPPFDAMVFVGTHRINVLPKLLGIRRVVEEL
jgi:hypothetical protein